MRADGGGGGGGGTRISITITQQSRLPSPIFFLGGPFPSFPRFLEHETVCCPQPPSDSAEGRREQPLVDWSRLFRLPFVVKPFRCGRGRKQKYLYRAREWKRARRNFLVGCSICLWCHPHIRVAPHYKKTLEAARVYIATRAFFSFSTHHLLWRSLLSASPPPFLFAHQYLEDGPPTERRRKKAPFLSLPSSPVGVSLVPFLFLLLLPHGKRTEGALSPSSSSHGFKSFSCSSQTTSGTRGC